MRNNQILQNKTHIEDNQKTLNFRMKYKTEKCRFWYENAYCPYGNTCAFAHHDSEIRSRKAINTHYKTKLCSNFFELGFCKYGQRCQYLHTKQSSISINPNHSKCNITDHLDQTRSYSLYPQEQNSKLIRVPRHALAFKLLQQFGLQALEAFEGRGSKILGLLGDKWEQMTSDSCGDSEDSCECLIQNTDQDRKLRMYSINYNDLLILHDFIREVSFQFISSLL